MKQPCAFLAMRILCACSEPAPPEARESHTPPPSSAPAPDDSWLPPGGSPPPAGVVVPAVGRAVAARLGGPRDASAWYAKFEIDPNHPRVIQYSRERATRYIGLPSYGEIGKELYFEQVTGAPIGKDSYLTPDGKYEVLVKGSLDSDTDNFFELFVGPPGG